MAQSSQPNQAGESEVQTALIQQPSTNITSAKQLYQRLFVYVKPYLWVFLLSLLCLAILSATNTGFLATIKKVTDDGFSKNASPEVLLYLPFMLFGLLAVRATSGFLSGFTMRWVGRRVVEDIRLHVFKHLLHLPSRFFDANSVGLISTKITFDSEQMFNAVTKVVISGVRDSLTILGALAYMIYLDWRLTCIFVVFAPIMAMYLKRMTPKLRNSGKYVQQSMGEMTQIIEEAVTGQRVVKIFAGQQYEYERFASIAAKNRQMMVRLGKISGLNSMVVELLAAVALGLVVYYTVGRFSAGEFAAFISALLILIAPIKGLTSINEDLQIGLAAAQHIFTLIDEPVEADTPMIAKDIAKQPSATIKAFSQLSLSQVTFVYESQSKPALNNLSMDVNRGEKVALVGLSGGGKSTLVQLLPRLYELRQGSISIDGVDIKTMPLQDLRQMFSMVSQEVQLFNDSIFNNIAYGVMRNATESEVVEAAKAAHAWEFIQQMPEGLYSQIGDRGVRLSGGQRQRLAIARAILKNAPILLLDEATSALDNESEYKVQEALERLMQNKTTIVIAHRLSTVENADRILVMEAGGIVESGTHQSLLSLGGRYAKLYENSLHA